MKIYSIFKIKIGDILHYEVMNLNRKGAKAAKFVFLGCTKSIVSADTRRSQCLRGK